MHLQQTKAASRRSGGPQYYFHDVPDTIKEHLRRRGACEVVLQTPYGIARSPFTAVGCDHKLTASGKVTNGRVGHDRIQQAQGAHSIGEAIREWYRIPQGRDFERIDVDVILHPEGHFILAPLRVYLRGKGRGIDLDKPYHPLAFTHDYQAPLWRNQIEQLRRATPDAVSWAAEQITRVVRDHESEETRNIKEEDLLRTAGALSVLGCHLSAYVGRGYDCPRSRIQMLDYPPYECPVEIKKRSRGFSYQILRYAPLPRAVVLCHRHDLRNTPDHVDIVELAALAAHLRTRTGA